MTHAEQTAIKLLDELLTATSDYMPDDDRRYDDYCQLRSRSLFALEDLRVRPPICRLLDVLNRYRFDVSTETSFQLAVHRVLLADLDALIEREFILGPRDRIDFLINGSLGLELKIKGRTAEVLRQLERYAADDRIKALVLCTTVALHRQLPDRVGGKPLHVHWQGGI